MSFDIEQTGKDMLAAIKGTVSDNWKEVKTVAAQFVEQQKDTLALMAQLRITGELSKEDFESRLEDQKLVLQAQMEAIAVLSKAIAQKAANAAMDVLQNAINTAINAVI